MLLAKRIRAIRELKKISQKEMYEILEISQSTYCGYETEGGNLQFSTIVKIATIFKCSIPFLTDIYSPELDEDKWKKNLADEI